MNEPFDLFGIECGLGWKTIVQPLIDLCNKYNVRIFQVKEKFGGLRFYIDEAPLVIHDAIQAAEIESFKTCEICGRPGELRGGSWLKTTCDAHADGKKSLADTQISVLRIKN